MATRNVTIQIGPDVPSLYAQLKGLLPPDVIMGFETLRHDLCMVYVAGLIDDDRFDDAATILMVRIKAAVLAHAKAKRAAAQPGKAPTV